MSRCHFRGQFPLGGAGLLGAQPCSIAASIGAEAVTSGSCQTLHVTMLAPGREREQSHFAGPGVRASVLLRSLYVKGNSLG